MLKRIIELSLQRRGVVIALSAVLLGYGALVARTVKLDVFPEFVPPQVTIQTEAPGLSPEQVEGLVTRPVEAAVNGAGELANIRSESIQGLSVITAEFQEDADVVRARQTLAERLGELAGTLPDGVKAPKMTPLTSSTMDLLKIGLVSKKMSPMELRTFADWTVRPRLLAVPGVAKASVFGGEVRQLQVIVQPERLVEFDLSMKEIADAARTATGVRGAGFIETDAQRLLVETDGQALSPEALGAVMLTRSNGATVRLSDVARIVIGPEPKFGDALVQGEAGVLLTLSGQLGANTMEVTEHLEAALAEMGPTFVAAGVTLYPSLHRPATFIERALQNVQGSLLIGGGLVAVVLFLFLLDLRTALISFLSIPLSLLMAVLVLDRWGVSINTMTLGGFAVAIGVVVDDAIIDVENIVRRLRENARLGYPRPAFDVVLDASLEVRSAVVYATFIVAVVFVPVLMMSGFQGRFFAPLGSAFILAVGASLLVALTITPALCLALLPKASMGGESRWVEWMKRLYGRGLLRVHRRPAGVVVSSLVLLTGAMACIPFFGGELLPEFREGHFVAGVSMIPGTSLPEMLRVGKKISAELLANEHIATVEQQIGRAELGEDTWGPNRCEFHIELKPTPAGEQQTVQDNIREILHRYPGVQSEVLTFLGDRIGESLSGETAQVVVSVFGDSLDVIDAKASELAAELGKVAGATDVQIKSPPGVPRMLVKLRPERLAQYGFRPVEVLEAVQLALQGAEVAQVFNGSRVETVSVLLDESARRDPEMIGALSISNASGLRMPLSALASIEPASGRDSIQHDGARRRQIVTCNVKNRDVVSFVSDAKRRVASRVKLPADVYLTWSGAAEAQSAASRELLLHSLIAAAGVLVLLSLVFRQPRHLLLVLANLPFALVGGVLAVFAVGGILSLGTLIGFVTLFGITMRNSIMMISHFEHLVSVEKLEWSVETAMRGAAERFVPILMTALVTGLGLLPLALGTGEAGREIEGPMAIVILGGLCTSTALNLFLLPTLALRFARFGVSQPGKAATIL